MSRRFQCKSIPISWIINQERRLDCGPYMSGAIEAKEILSKIQAIKEPLQELTNGIYHAGREGRQWVETSDHGTPFMGSTDILASDLSILPFMSNKQIQANPNFVIREGWTLITRTGTIGKMAYARSDMDRFACSEHVIRVVPNEDKVKPGYVYAYLSSRFGLPLVMSGTYGSIIQSIEPHHIASLPVPRLGVIEDQVHELVQRASYLRVEANRKLSEVKQDLELEIGSGPVKWKYKHVQAFATKALNLSSYAKRLDAFHHIGYVGEAIEKANVNLIEFKKVGRALLPPFLKRIWVEEGGYEFLGGSDLMRLDLKSDKYISTNIRTIDKFIVKDGYVLFPCVGQRYGIYGSPVLANRQLIGKAVSQAVMRLIPNEKEDAGYVSVYLATAFGHRLSMRFSAGTSIPALSEEGAAQTLIYWPEKNHRRKISIIAEQAWESRAMATELEDEARYLVEKAIEGGSH